MSEEVGQTDIASVFTGFVPLILISCIFYILILRPQQQKIRDHDKMIASIKQGDKVVTSGGIMGTVSKSLKDESWIMVEIANNVVVKISKETIISKT